MTARISQKAVSMSKDVRKLQSEAVPDMPRNQTAKRHCSVWFSRWKCGHTLSMSDTTFFWEQRTQSTMQRCGWRPWAFPFSSGSARTSLTHTLPRACAILLVCAMMERGACYSSVEKQKVGITKRTLTTCGDLITTKIGGKCTRSQCARLIRAGSRRSGCRGKSRHREAQARWCFARK